MVKVWTTRSQNNTRHGQHATGAQHRCWHSDVARTVSKGEYADNVHVQQTREKALLIDWWWTLGWQKSSTPTTRKSRTKSLVWSSSSGVALMCMAPSKHTQAKVGCAGLFHVEVCSSGPQCLEPSPCCPQHPSCTSGPSCTSARSDSAWLCAVQTKARVCPGTVCLPSLCSGEPRCAGNSAFQPRPSKKCDPHQWLETALTSALLRAAKRAVVRRCGPERQLRARVQCPWQCCQPGAPPLSAVRKIFIANQYHSQF